MRGIYGLCPPDGKSCDQSYEVNSEGVWTTNIAPNPSKQNAPAAASQKTMPAAEFSRLKELVLSKAFDEEMTKGFACQGGRKDPDATWKITFSTSAGKRVQHGEYCISGPSDAVNTPRTVLGLLRR
jgi:hypothetical protein